MRVFVEYYVVVACLAGWAIVSAWGIANIRAYRRTPFYRPVAARITAVRTHTEMWSPADGPGWQPWRLTHFTYRFEVDGRSYGGSSEHDFVGTYSAMGHGEKKTGDEITVYYDPLDPRRCCASRFGFRMGVFIVLLGQVLLAMAIKSTMDALPSPAPPTVQFESQDFSLAGHWYGHVEEARIGSYNARLELHNATPGGWSGRVAYSPFGCRTLLSFVAREGATYTFRESHESGQCTGLKTIDLKGTPAGSLTWTSVYEDGTRRGRGVLARDD